MYYMLYVYSCIRQSCICHVYLCLSMYGTYVRTAHSWYTCIRYIHTYTVPIITRSTIWLTLPSTTAVSNLTIGFCYLPRNKPLSLYTITYSLPHSATLSILLLSTIHHSYHHSLQQVSWLSGPLTTTAATHTHTTTTIQLLITCYTVPPLSTACMYNNY